METFTFNLNFALLFANFLSFNYTTLNATLNATLNTTLNAVYLFFKVIFRKIKINPHFLL